MIVDHVAIIGLGSIGRRHLRNLKKIRPEIEATIVRSGHGEDWPELELADRTVFSLSEAIAAGVQAAIISSPAAMHIKQAVRLAQEGIHLLIEKPVGSTLDGVDELMNVVLESDIVTLVGYVLRYDLAAQTFNELLKAGKHGHSLHVRVEAGSYLPDWRPEQDYKKTVSASPELGGGVLLELSHEFDYIRWFFGEIKTIVAHLHNSGHLGIEVEECADMIMTNINGLPISLHLDFHRRHAMRRCIVAGSEGTLTWDLIADNVVWHPAGGAEEVLHFGSARDDIFQRQLVHFFSCIESGDEPRVSLKDGVEAVRLVSAAKKSSEMAGTRQELI